MVFLIFRYVEGIFRILAHYLFHSGRENFSTEFQQLVISVAGDFCVIIHNLMVYIE